MSCCDASKSAGRFGALECAVEVAGVATGVAEGVAAGVAAGVVVALCGAERGTKGIAGTV